MRRVLLFLYSLAAYALFLGVFLYLIAFVGNLGVPRSVDAGPATDTATAVALDLLLVALFGLQHSVMARPAFKRWITRSLPAPVERSTFVLLASLVLALLFWQWRPLPATVWHAEGGVAVLLWIVFGLGWGTVLLSTFLINHFDLFGLRQTWVHLRQRALEPLAFRTTLLYRVVRHPIMLGFLLAFWAIPLMTAGHLLFAAAMTVYILVGVHHEERDLVRSLGRDYVDYRRRTPAFVPGLPGARSDLPVTPEPTELQPGR
ncbi:isoprenylcysteine carboxylmethyltransferase family protein [Ramlibacter sp. USB13]|uniref:methanethiol S-methyltransferase n=1 Tax=Ramlibacter cellulosilyticus TaxID=2764187 RepID=A0A923MMJ7_9BURK|nr:methanethiol S-methyltransferase [Ramlibacter cellulosilyticus]MBC5782387.1 isoprenylcysteine carboxylmethyltransferase family protein [Ramlibacter cellulosilyticus]